MGWHVLAQNPESISDETQTLKTKTGISLNVFTAASPTISPIIDSEQENPFNSKKCLSVFIISHTFSKRAGNWSFVNLLKNISKTGREDKYLAVAVAYLSGKGLGLAPHSTY